MFILRLENLQKVSGLRPATGPESWLQGVLFSVTLGLFSEVTSR